MAKTNAIIIKRIKKADHAHHGGAWKVAYADFVTAMMAFFLLLWLLNATTDAQKRGIADYFAPTLATKSLTSGAGGVLGGRTMTEDGSQANSSAPPAITTDLNQAQDFVDGEDDTPGKVPNPNDANANSDGSPNADQPRPKPTASVNNFDSPQLSMEDRAVLAKMSAGAGGEADKLTDQQVEALKSDREERQLKKAEHELKQAIQSEPDLQPLAQNLVVERTSEGLRIQLVDQDKAPMFASGSTEPDDAARKLMGLVARVIDKMPNKIAITGHTDASPFHRSDYDNYDLSVDRARSMRHALMTDGLSPDRIAAVEGKGATEPLTPDAPAAPINRRVSIVVLREFPATGAAGPAAAAAPTPAAVEPVIAKAAIIPPGTTTAAFSTRPPEAANAPIGLPTFK